MAHTKWSASRDGGTRLQFKWEAATYLTIQTIQTTSTTGSGNLAIGMCKELITASMRSTDKLNLRDVHRYRFLMSQGRAYQVLFLVPIVIVLTPDHFPYVCEFQWVLNNIPNSSLCQSQLWNIIYCYGE